MKIILFTSLLFLVGCNFNATLKDEPVAYVPIASATINVVSTNDYAQYSKPKIPWWMGINRAVASVSQGSATVAVSYSNPSVVSFSINTSAFGTAMTISGTDLNLGSISIASLDDNTLRVCTGVGAPGNKCNRLYIRVFTLGTASGGVTNTSGFINVSDLYSLPVYAGNVSTEIGYNAAANASIVSNAAVVHTYTIPNGVNRVRNLVIPSIPIKADLSNAGNGLYEMNLVVQYALGYVP